MPRARIIIAAISLVLVLAGFAIWFLPSVSKDPLCEFARARGMECVALASPGVYERGAIIVPPPQAKTSATLPPASEYLLSEACVLPGAKTEFAQFHDDPSRQIAFPNQRISMWKSLLFQGSLSSKEVGGIELKLGPKAESSVSIDLTSDGVQAFNIDTTRFQDALGSCAIRRSCAERLNNGNGKIVKQFLVAKNLTMKVTEEGGRSYPLAVAVGNGVVSADFNMGASQAQRLELPSGGDFVFGALFFDQSELANVNTCDRDLVVLDSSQTTSVTATIYPRTAGERPHSQQLTGIEPIAEVSYTARDRSLDEGMVAAEARSWGKVIVNNDQAEVEFLSRVFGRPGERWISSGPQAVDYASAFKTIYADAIGKIESESTLTLANRSDDTRMIVLTVHDSERTSIGTLIGGYTAALSPLKLIRKDGKEEHYDAVWMRGNDKREFRLGQVSPGEVVTIALGYARDAKFSFSEDSGTLVNDVKLTFSLK